jgi:hypothetical protein
MSAMRGALPGNMSLTLSAGEAHFAAARLALDPSARTQNE